MNIVHKKNGEWVESELGELIGYAIKNRETEEVYGCGACEEEGRKENQNWNV